MTWLKLDDGFTQHPKLAGWTAPQKWSWLEVLTYCARYDTGGRIPDDLDILPRSVTKSLLDKAEKARLIDRANDGGRVVHDWPIYNGKTVHEKVAYCLAKHPKMSANDVYRAIGGKRELVLATVENHRRSGSPSGSQGGSQEPLSAVPELVPSPSRPVPKEQEPVPAPTPEAHYEPNGAGAGDGLELIDQKAILAATANPDDDIAF